MFWSGFAVGRAKSGFEGGENEVSAIGPSDSAFEHLGVADCFQENGGERFTIQLKFDGVVILGRVGAGSTDVTVIEDGKLL